MNRIQKLYAEFPPKFWIVVAVSFVDNIGRTLVFPFISLYITGRFGVGMTQAGLVLGIFALFGLIGGMLGGALTDRFGRRKLILFGLVFSALSTLALGLVDTFALLFPLAAGIGLLSDIAGPAHSAMIADLLPESKRQEGFGLLRVTGNLSWLIGPTVGGFVAGRSFFALFATDAAISCLVAVLFFLLVPETKPAAQPDKPHETLLGTFRGYGRVLGDRAYLAFLFAGVLMMLVYGQMYNSLSVFLRDVHGLSPQFYGYLLTSSAITVILFQFSLSRRIKSRPPFALMALGVLFYMVGFGMFGLVSVYPLFVLAILIITVGEMIVVPVSMTLATDFAPVEMRGRYMALFGLVWFLPSAIGPTAAGVILDNYNPNLLWYLGAALCFAAALSYFALHLRLGRQPRFAPAAAKDEPALASSAPDLA